MSSLDRRLTALEGTRSTMTKSPAERMTAQELNAALDSIQADLERNEAQRVSKLRARLTDAQFHAHESRRQAQFAAHDARIAAIPIRPEWQAQGFDVHSLSNDQFEALVCHVAAEMRASHSPTLEIVPC